MLFRVDGALLQMNGSTKKGLSCLLERLGEIRDVEVVCSRLIRADVILLYQLIGDEIRGIQQQDIVSNVVLNLCAD